MGGYDNVKFGKFVEIEVIFSGEIEVILISFTTKLLFEIVKLVVFKLILKLFSLL